MSLQQQKDKHVYVCVRKRGSTSWSKGRFNELNLELEVTTAKADTPQRKEGTEGRKEAQRKEGEKKERESGWG